MKNICIYEYNFCNLGIAEEDGAIVNILLNPMNIPDGMEKNETSILKKAYKQFDEYFRGKRKVFDLPLNLRGTEFQLKTWKQLQTIPYGQTRSYGQLAEMTGDPKASRAVGMANNKNPISIIVPCHRVIGHDGKLTGYGGGLELKQQLLDLEAGYK